MIVEMPGGMVDLLEQRVEVEHRRAKPEVREVVVGLGMMGQISGGASQHAGSNIVGVVGYDMNEVAVYLGKQRAPNVAFAGTFSDLDAIAAKYGDLFNRVKICTPNKFHRDHAKWAAINGKDESLEKPMGRTVAEAQEVLDAALENKVVANIHSQYRYYTTIAMLKNMIDTGQIDAKPVNWGAINAGKVKKIKMGYIQGWQANPSGDIGWRPDVELAGYGKLTGDLGSHLLMTLMHFFDYKGTFKEFNAERYNVIAKRRRIKPGLGALAGAFATPTDAPAYMWEDMDMLDKSKFSGDDRIFATGKYDTGRGYDVDVEFAASQVDTHLFKPGTTEIDYSTHNDNNFYAEVEFEKGVTVRWRQEDPNRLMVEYKGEIRPIERPGAPGQFDAPGGHPDGYEIAGARYDNEMLSVRERGDPKEILAYTKKHLGAGVDVQKMVERWNEAELSTDNSDHIIKNLPKAARLPLF